MSAAGPDGGAERRIAVVGLGNVLMRDDALGPTAISLLVSRYDFAPGVAVEDLGTPGLDLHPHLDGLDVVIIVDTVLTNEKGLEFYIRTTVA